MRMGIMKRIVTALLCLAFLTGSGDVMLWAIDPGVSVYSDGSEFIEYGPLDVFLTEDPLNIVTYDGESSFLGARVVAKRSDGSLIGVIANRVALMDDYGNQLYYDPETGGTTTRNTGAIHALYEWVDYDIDIGSPGDIIGITGQDGR